MNRRGFLKTMTVVGASSVLIPWKPLEASEITDSATYITSQLLELDPAFKQMERARREVTTERAEAILGDLRAALLPHVSFADWEYNASLRGWQLVATRWYADQRGTRKEIGISAVLPYREVATMPDSIFEKIPETVSRAMLDALVRKERADGLTWNPVTLVGWA